MNILHITPLYLPSVGGTEVHTRELSIELARMGHTVSIFTTDALYLDDLFPKIRRRPKSLGDAVFKDSSVVIYRFHVTNSLSLSFVIRCASKTLDLISKIGLSTKELSYYADALVTSPVVPRMYFKLVNSSDIDVLNSTPFPFGWSLFLKDICRKKQIPFIITPRAHTVSWIYSQPFLLKVARESDAIIALTEHEKSFFVKKGVSKDKIYVTGIGVNYEKYQKGNSYLFKLNHGLPQNSKIVLFIGRIDKGKGVDFLLASMKLVWNKLPQVYLVLIGRSTKDTERLRLYYQNDKRVVILPDASEKTKVDALSSCNVLVLPSIYESFGGVFLEAWSAGKPVIGCKVPSVECVIDDMVDGFLVSLNEKELASRIIYLLENENVAKKMGTKGKQKVLNNYTWKIIAKKTLAVYESVSKN